MKYIKQFGIIAGVSFVGEVLNQMLPFPIPASVYGLVLMVVLLMTGIVKLEMIEDTADYLIGIMVLFFVPSSVGLMTSFDAMKGSVMQLFIVALVSTIVVTAVVGLIAQGMMKLMGKDGEK